MEEKINSKLVDTIAPLFPTKKECIDFIATSLSIGKSAAKRRLNKEVYFSYGEAVILAQALKLSLDSLITSENIHINLSFNKTDASPIDLSQSMIERYLDLHDKGKDSSNTKIMVASNIIPYSMMAKYDSLYKFYLYKKYFQNTNVTNIKAFSELTIPATHKPLRKKLEVKIDSIQSSTIIFDKHVILETIDDILYFKELRLLNEEDLILLRDDLQELIQDMEISCSSGKNKQKNNIYIYISDIALDASCVYADVGDNKYAQVQIHSMNTIITENKMFCSMQKRWIDSVKKYSTLISRGGEIERKLFFDIQKTACMNITT